MKDYSLELQTAYFNLLNTNITYGGNVVPVYDVVPKNPVYPYIEIGSKTDVQRGTKSSFGNEVTQGISIVSRFDSTSGGSRQPIYIISDKLQTIIAARPVPFNIDGLNVITSTLDNALTRKELTDTHLYIVYELRFRHRIEQLILTFDETFDPTFS
jgi:hypothetical protein